MITATKLPKIQIKKFYGNLLSYLSFWGPFKKIHEDKNLDDVDKFHYLAQSMLPGTRAYELIESYPLTSGKLSEGHFCVYGAFW
ncbi:integrase catalytic domain-containing protein [Caerostris extrusa]|uniref:Integrase catalytic domain-containing protein n=1 Tax=Caerostris extrusa TaxID=172846 RepID=A0AAV4U101_CAEEX|nr:integrase catalytic domain-containing protein [Caerostris extrusa]